VAGHDYGTVRGEAKKDKPEDDDQARLQLIGLSSHEAAEQIQFLLTGAPVTQVREDIRTADVIARSAGTDRLDPSKLNDMTLMNHWGKAVP